MGILTDNLDDKSIYRPISEIADEVPYSPDSVSLLARTGKIDARKIEGIWHVSVPSVQEYASRYMPTAELADQTPYSQEYLSLLARRGKVDARKINGKWHVSPASLDAYAAAQGKETEIVTEPVVSAGTRAVLASSPTTAPAQDAQEKIDLSHFLEEKQEGEDRSKSAPESSSISESTNASPEHGHIVSARSLESDIADVTGGTRKLHMNITGDAFTEESPKMAEHVAPSPSAPHQSHETPQYTPSTEEARPVGDAHDSLGEKVRDFFHHNEVLPQGGSVPTRPATEISAPRNHTTSTDVPGQASSRSDGRTYPSPEVSEDPVDRAAERLAVALASRFDAKGPIGRMNDTAKQTVRTPKGMMAVMVAVVVTLFVLVGGFSFGNADALLSRASTTFRDATTVQGHVPGTHANEVLLLDDEGKVSIYGHIETHGQLRSYAKDGIAPLVIDSTTTVENLSAQYFDGLQSKEFTLAFVTKNGNFTTERVVLRAGADISGGLTADGINAGQITTRDLTAQDITVGNTLVVSGATMLLDELVVEGKLSALSDVFVSGDLDVEGDTNLGGALTVSSNITAPSAVLTSGLTVEGPISGETLGISGAASVGDLTAGDTSVGSLTVNSVSIFTATSTFKSNIVVQGTGESTFAGSVDIDGDLNVDGAITSPSLSSAGTSTANRYVASSTGSAADPAFTFASDLDTGIYSPGADQLAITTGGVERFTIDASGNIALTGTGTSTMAGNLDIAGDVEAVTAYITNLRATNIYDATLQGAITGNNQSITGLSTLGVGTTSPSTTLGVAGSAYITDGVGIGVLNTAAGTLQTSGSATFGGDVTISGTATSTAAGNFDAAGDIAATNLYSSGFAQIGSALTVGSSLTVNSGLTTLSEARITTLNATTTTVDTLAANNLISNTAGLSVLSDLRAGTLNASTTLIDTLTLTNPLAVTSGGTGQGALAAGEILLGNGTSGITSTSTLSVVRGGTGATSLTAGGVLFGGGTDPITASGVLTNGQLLIGDGSGVPTAATLTAGTNVTITNGAGSIEIAVNTTGLDADTLDGLDSAQFLRSDASDEFEAGGTLTISGTLDTNGDVSFADTDIAFDGASTNFTVTGDFSINTDDLVLTKSTGNVALGHNLDVAGSAQFGSGDVNLIDSTGKITGLSTTYFNTDTSSNLAGIITDETGSGALVFGASPTLSGATLNGLSIIADARITTFNATTTSVGTLRSFGAVDFDTTLNVDGDGTFGGLIHSLAATGTSTFAANVEIDGNLEVTGVQLITSDQTIGGDLMVNGDTTLGSDSTDTVTFNARVNSHIVPTATNTYDLGSDALRWRMGYFETSVGVGGTATTTGTSLTAAGAYAIDAGSTLSINTTNNQAVMFGTGAVTVPTLQSTNATTTTLYTDSIGVASEYFTTLTGAGLTINAGSLDVGAGSCVTVNANDVAVTANCVDAATLDSLNSTQFLRSDTSDSFTSGTLTFDAGTTLDIDGTFRADGQSVLADARVATLNATTTSVDTLTVFDNVTLGDGSGDTITPNGRFNAHLIPATSNAYDFGSDALRWRTAYLENSLVLGGNATATPSSFTTAGAYTIDTDGTLSINTTDNQAVTFGTGTVTAGGALTVNGNATLGNAATDSVVLRGDVTLTDSASTDQLMFGADVGLYRGAANRLDLATGDSFNLVSGALQVGGTTVISSNRGLFAADGTELNPSISFSADTNTGLYRPAADTIGFVTNQTEVARFTSGGFFGIATDTPAVELSVDGSGYFTGGLGIGVSTTTAGVLQTSGDAWIGGSLTVNGAFTSVPNGQVLFTGAPTGTGIDEGTLYINPPSAGSNNVLIGIAVNGTERVRIDSEGDVQIVGAFSSTATGGINDFAGALVVDGNTTLGDASSDTVTFNANIASDIIPNQDNAFDLGSATNRWQNFYAVNTQIDNLIAGGTASSTFYINQDNATADAEDSALEFERGTESPNAQIKWNSSADRLEVNNFPLHVEHELTVAGTGTSTYSGGPLWLTGSSQGSALADAILYINPGSAAADEQLLSIGVAGVQRFEVDAEGDTLIHASLGVENALFDISDDTLTINDNLRVNGNNIKDSVGTTRLTLGATNTITGNAAVTGNFTAAGAGPHYFSAGNVGVGETTPLYLFTVGNGDLFGVNSSGFVLIPDGTEGNPAFTFTTDTNTGLFQPGDDLLAFTTGGTEAARFNASGFLGIATDTPSAELSVEGSGIFSQDLYVGGDLTIVGSQELTGTSTAHHFAASSLGAADDPSYTFTADQDTGIFSAGANIFNITTAGTERLRIDATGQVGIGGTPSVPFHLLTSAASGARFETTNTSAALLDLYHNPASGMPAPVLSFSGVNTSAARKGLVTLTATTTDQTAGSEDADFYLSTVSGGTLAERLRLTSTGSLGIGTTTPSTTLSVNGSGYLTGGLGVGVLNTTAGTLQTSGSATVGDDLTVSGDTSLEAATSTSHYVSSTLGLNSEYFTTLTGAGLTINSGSLDVGAGSCITVNANDVAVTANCVDATTLDSIDSGSFLRSDTSDNFTSGTLTFDAGTILDVNGLGDFADLRAAVLNATTTNLGTLNVYGLSILPDARISTLNATTTNTDSLTAGTADINGGTIDGTVIGGSSAVAGTFTSLTATGATSLQNATATSAYVSSTLGLNSQYFTTLTGAGLTINAGSLDVGAGSCITVNANDVAVTANCVDATTLDSIDSGSFLRSDTSDSYTSGTLTFDAGTTLDVDGTLRGDGLSILADARVNTLNATSTYSDTLTVPGLSILTDGRIATLNATTTNAGTLRVFGNSQLDGTLSTATTTVMGDLMVQSSGGAATHLYVDNNNGRVGIGTASPGHALDISKSAVGSSVQMSIQNTDNTNGSSHSILRIATGGSSSGDARINFSAVGETDWNIGIDNNDANKFKIGPAIDGSSFITVTTTGLVGIGDTSPAALLTVGSGDLFQVDSSGNVSTSGTLTVNNGLSILSDARVATLNASTTSVGTLRSFGAVDFDTTLNVDGATTLANATSSSHYVSSTLGLNSQYFTTLTGAGLTINAGSLDVGAGSCITVNANDVAVTANCVDATTLDSIDSGSFLRSDTSDSFTSGVLTIDAAADLDINGDLIVSDTDVAFDGASTNFAFTGDATFNTDDLTITKSTGVVTLAHGLTVSAGSVALPAGVISNTELENSTVSYGGIQLSLGGSDATPAFDLADATNLPIVAGTTGTLTVVRGGTGATTLTGLLIGNGTSAVTATTLSSGISGQLSDETGSGALVFGTSPTLSGATLNGLSTIADARITTLNATTTSVGTLRAFGAVTLDSTLTATGGLSTLSDARIAILNATTTNIDTLTVNTSLTNTGTSTARRFLASDLGGAGAAAFGFSGDTNTGIYSPGADQLSITTGGTERVRVGSGNTIILGSGEGGTPAATTLRGAAAAGSNIAGADFTFDASNGTGSGGSGMFVFRTAASTSVTPTYASSTVDSQIDDDTTDTFTTTLPSSGSNKIAIMSVSMGDGVINDDDTWVSSIELDSGEDFTRLDGAVAPGSQGDHAVELWYLVNPPSGNKTVTVTFVDSILSTVYGLAVYENVDQSSPFGTVSTNSGGSLSATTTVSSSAGELVIGVLAKANAGETPTVGAGQTERWNALANGIGRPVWGAGSEEAGAATVEMSWDWSGTDRPWAILGVPLKPVDVSESSNTFASRLKILNTGNVAVGDVTANELLTVNGVLSLAETSAPSLTSGFGKLYVSSSDSKLYFIDDSGSSYDLTAGGGGGSSEWVDAGTHVYPKEGDYAAFPYFTATSTSATSTIAHSLTVDGTTLVVNANENRVGIGTASPGFTLDVGGTLNTSGAVTFASTLNVTGNITNTGTTTARRLLASDLGNATAAAIGFSGDLNTGIYSSGADTLNFTTGGTERVRINSSGQLLALNGSSGTPTLSFVNDTNTGMYLEGADSLAFSTGGTRRILIDSSGRVGVGVTPAAESLELSGALLLGNAAGTANGTMRWTGSDFEGRKGGAWVSLTGGGGSSLTDHISWQVTTDSNASSAQYNMFQSSNYTGMASTTHSSSGIVYTSTEGRFTIATTGKYFINLNAIVEQASGSLMDFVIAVNGTGVATSTIFNAHQTDPDENTFSIIRSLTAGDYVEFLIDGVNTVSVEARSGVNIFPATDGGADLAENYVAGETVEPADVVVFGEGRKIFKSTAGYQKALAGVVSTFPGLLLDKFNGGVPLALSGRVPVRVTTENGPIAVGDYLTSSATVPGAAMRATGPGPVIGTALSAFGTEGEDVQQGAVEVFVNLGHYSGEAHTELAFEWNEFGTSLNTFGATVNIEELSFDSAKLLSVKPIKFSVTGEDGITRTDVGFNIDDLAAVAPDLVTWSEATDTASSTPEKVKYEKLGLYLLEMFKGVEGRLAALEKQASTTKSESLSTNSEANSNDESSNTETPEEVVADPTNGSDELAVVGETPFESTNSTSTVSNGAGDEDDAATTTPSDAIDPEDTLATDGDTETGELTTPSPEATEGTADLATYKFSTGEAREMLGTTWKVDGQGVALFADLTKSETEEGGRLAGLFKTIFGVAKSQLAFLGNQARSVMGENSTIANETRLDEIGEDETKKMYATYGVASSRAEFMIAGSGVLQEGADGETVARIRFHESFISLISETEPIRVSVTPTARVNGGLYVAEKTRFGFEVRQISGQDEGATFDYIVIARRAGFERGDSEWPSGAELPQPDPSVPPASQDVSENTTDTGTATTTDPGAADTVSTSTPSEEAVNTGGTETVAPEPAPAPEPEPTPEPPAESELAPAAEPEPTSEPAATPAE